MWRVEPEPLRQTKKENPMKNETTVMRQKNKNIYNFTAYTTVTPTGRPSYDNLISYHLHFIQDFTLFEVHNAVCIK